MQKIDLLLEVFALSKVLEFTLPSRLNTAGNMSEEVVTRVKKVKKIKKITVETNEEAASEGGSTYDSESRNPSQGDVCATGGTIALTIVISCSLNYGICVYVQ